MLYESKTVMQLLNGGNAFLGKIEGGRTLIEFFEMYNEQYL